MEYELIFREFIEDTDDLITCVDKAGRYRYVNRAAEKILGLAPEACIGRSAFDWVHPEDLEKTLQSFREWIQARLHRASIENRLVNRRTGQPFQMLWTVSFHYDDRGEPLRINSIGRNITERKLAEEALRKSESFSSSIIQSSRDCIKVLDLEGRLRFMNQGGQILLGIDNLGLYLDQGYADLWDAVQRPRVERALERARRGLTDTFQGEFPTVTGEPRWWDMVVSPIQDAEGRVEGLLVVSRDITEKKRTEAELTRAKESAEAASRAKSQFLAVMSHEIRTPMNAIMGMTDLTLESDLTGQQREYLEMVRSSSAHLLTLINDILDLSRIESGKVAVLRRRFSLRESMAEIIRTFTHRAGEKGLDLIYRVDPEVPDDLVGDVGRLRQVIYNLVGNAIKFTPAGKVRVDISLAGADADGVDLRVRVADTGIGVSKEQQEEIFDPFIQADASISRPYEGAGLGLAISRSLVEMMGGDLSMESEPGAGSAFSFTLSLGRGEGRGMASGAAGSPAGPLLHDQPKVRGPAPPLKVLVVEDNPFNRKLISILLEKKGHSVTLAPDGWAALAALETAAYDLVLMDVQMPGMDGVETTAAIRERESNGEGRLPIVAITAHAMAGDRERFLAAGMDGYLAKPITAEGLDRVVALVTGGPSEESG
jgi:PAS domain S-box-containing protein